MIWGIVSCRLVCTGTKQCFLAGWCRRNEVMQGIRSKMAPQLNHPLIRPKYSSVGDFFQIRSAVQSSAGQSQDSPRPTNSQPSNWVQCFPSQISFRWNLLISHEPPDWLCHPHPSTPLVPPYIKHPGFTPEQTIWGLWHEHAERIDWRSCFIVGFLMNNRITI